MTFFDPTALLIMTEYIPLSDISRFDKLNDNILLDNIFLPVLMLIANPLWSHVIVGGGLGTCFRVT